MVKYLLLFDGITDIFPKTLQCELPYLVLGCREMFLCLRCWFIQLILMVSSQHLRVSASSTITTVRTTLNVHTEPSIGAMYF